MSESKPYKNEAEEANHKMSEKFKDYNARVSPPANSDEEWANHQIQEQFYDKTNDDNFLPFHIDINNPPVKK